MRPRRFPVTPGSGANLAALLAEHGDADEAIGLLQPALALEPDHHALHYNLGTALHRLSRFEEAHHHLQRSVELAPDFGPAWHNLGNTLVDLGEVAEGFAAYDKAHATRRKPGARTASEKTFTTTSRTKLEHDAEQLRHLREHGVLQPLFDDSVAHTRSLGNARCRHPHGSAARRHAHDDHAALQPSDLPRSRRRGRGAVPPGHRLG